MSFFDGAIVIDNLNVLIYIGMLIVLFIYMIFRIILNIFDKFDLKKKKVDIGGVNYFNDYVLKEYEKNYEKNLSFRTKADNIKRMIVNDKIYDIKELAKNSKSSVEECVMIIKFLENKKIISNLYINTRAYRLAECNLEEEKLLLKYAPFLNRKLTKYTIGNGSAFSFDELLYLYKKGFIPEIEIDEINKQIIFLDLNKKHSKDLITIVCNSCGALNDVNRGQKIKCKYCGSEIVGPKK